MKRVAVIGGGISGLAAAFAIQKRKKTGAEVDSVLFESSQRFGGVIKTEQIEGCILEAGPDSFLTEKSWATDLCRQLELEDQLVPSNDAERKTYLLVGGQLEAIPEGLMFMVPTKLLPVFSSRLFSWKTKLQILGEWFYKPSAATHESTVAEFVARHYGREMVEVVADPLLAGVYGGSADELSVQAVLPRFVEMEANYGSLGKAMIETRSASADVPRKPLFTSLRNGMQQLTDSLLSRIPESARRLEATVNCVRPESGKWLITGSGRTEEFDGVILAVPAYSAASLLSDIPKLGENLSAIPYSSSVIVSLVFDRSVRESLPTGFGFLVPRRENQRLLATTFVHNKFPNRAPEDRAVLRCFLGGSRDKNILEKSEAEIFAIVREELRQILEITARPLAFRLQRWPRAMAQYVVGHKGRMEAVQRSLAEMRGLALAGNAYSGIGIPDCIRSGTDATAKVFAELGLDQ
jgi:oxygen-dependent protoporphyrinogen oxidase